MKKIMVKYTSEIDNDEYYRFCKNKMIGDRDLHAMLRDVAKTEGLIAIRKTMQEEWNGLL